MATSPRIRATWTGIAMSAAIGAFALCAVLALLVRSGLEFALAAFAAATIVLAAFACRRAAQDTAEMTAKVSGDVTAIAQRLLRLEGREAPAGEGRASPELSPLAADLAAITHVVSSLAESVGSQDRRLFGLEQARAAAALAPPSPVSEASELMGRRASPPQRPAAIADAVQPPSAALERADDAESGDTRSDDDGALTVLSSRDDFARAASAILRRLRRDALHIVETAEDEAVIAGLEAGEVELHLQPVVMLPQRRTAFYATFAHIRRSDGTTTPASDVADLLLRRGHRPRLDALTLGQARTIARHLAGRRSASRMAVRLSRASLGDPGFVQGAAALLREGPAERLILMLDHAELDHFSGHENAALDAFRALGATLALEAVSDLGQDWRALARRGISIGMLDAATILSGRPHGVTLAFAAEAARSGIQLVATGIDSDGLIPDLLDFDLPLAMGSGLAPPRPVRNEVLAPSATEEPAGAAPGESAPARIEDGPVSFRDFLRRAG